MIVWLAGLTTWLTEPELPLWFASPEYVAVTVSVPPARAAVVHVATPVDGFNGVELSHETFQLTLPPVTCRGFRLLRFAWPFTAPFSPSTVAVNVTDPP